MKKYKLFVITLLFLTIITTNSFASLSRLTAYNENERDSRPYGHLNCQGGVLGVGQCAADLKYHHLGDVVDINGMGTFVISDCGSGVKGRDRYDIYVSSLKEVREFGVKYRDAVVINRSERSSKSIAVIKPALPLPSVLTCYSSKHSDSSCSTRRTSSLTTPHSVYLASN